MLTDTYIKNLKPKSQRYDSKREKGLSVKVEPSGLKAFYLTYSINGKKTRYCIGQYTKQTGLAWARKKAEPMKALIAQGICPKTYYKEQARQREIEHQQRMTFSTVLAVFSEIELPRRALKTEREKLRILNREFLPVWSDTEIIKIGRAQVHQALDAIKSDSMRKHAHAHINDLFNFCVSRGILQVNPASHIKLKSSTPRERVLSEREIKYFWLNIDNAKLTPARHMNPEVKRILKLLLLTGQRRAEITNATANQIKGDWLEIGKTKNKHLQRVYLSRVSKGLLHSESPGRVFTVHVDTVTRQLRQWIAHTGQEHYTVHDLRRTVGTELAKLGVSRFDSDRILNHTDSSVSGTYDRHGYDSQRKSGLIKWEDRLFRLVEQNSQTNVISGVFSEKYSN